MRSRCFPLSGELTRCAEPETPESEDRSTDRLSSLDHLFAANRAWAAEIKTHDPGFFERLAHQQTPEYLWIG